MNAVEERKLTFWVK